MKVFLDLLLEAFELGPVPGALVPFGFVVDSLTPFDVLSNGPCNVWQVDTGVGHL